MTDKELLDGLQRLIEEKVTVVRTCRSGVKIVVADGTLEYMLTDDKDWSPVSPLREYFGAGTPDADGKFTHPNHGDCGPDLRVAIQRALAGEAA